MMTPSSLRIISCKCGTVKFELTGPPILSSICHCDDCQKGSAQIEQLPGAPKILDSWGGSPYVLYRKDRIQLLQGREKLTEQIIKNDTKTVRVVASCCNSPLYVNFKPGHWISFYQQRFPPPIPQAQMRMQTRYMPSGDPPSDGLPQHRGYSFSMITKLLASRMAMGFKNKDINW